MVVRRMVAVLGAGVIGLSLVPAGTTASAIPLTQTPAAVRAAASASANSAAAKATNRKAATKKAAAKKASAKKATTKLRIATFNVRTSRARDKRSWLKRAPDVARTILSRNPGVVTLQELGPGRADGKKGKTGNRLRQTQSLVNTLKKLGGQRYKLTRVTLYNPPMTKHGTQGARILYDTSRYSLVSNCRETTGKRNYSRTCAMELPLNAGDSKGLQRSAAYALLKDKSTGQKFWVASAHLDDRHGGKAREAKMNRLRQRQAAYVVNKVASMNNAGYPVVFGGDINSWRNDKGNWAPHRTLVAKGFVNTIKAPVRINPKFSTVNHFKTTQKKSGRPTGAHLDVVMVKGAKSFTRWENVTKRVDTARPSDHNMVVADFQL